MYCKNCGNVINQNERVCSKCGIAVEIINSNQPVDVPLVQQETSFVNQSSIPPIVETPVQQIVEQPIVEQNTQPVVKRKNPNTVLYIVLAVVFIVAIVCLTLVITQG